MSRRSEEPQPRVESQTIPLGNLDPDAVKVVRRLVRHRHLAYLVGGCVRDLLLGCRPKDFDVATSARPSDLRKLFRNCRIIGRRFRLAHMHFRDGKIIEVATFRSDPSPENGDDEHEHDDDEDESLLVTRDNVFGEPHEDARRRDFTINGLFYDIKRGRIIDYVDGLDDVERRLVRTIGDPNIRLQEDPLRILRAIKFTARQDLGMDPALYDAAVRHRELIFRSAPQRLFEEILRLLRGGAAQRSVYVAWEMGVLAEILPELDHWFRCGGEPAHRSFRLLRAVDDMVRQGKAPGDTVLLAALLDGPLRAAMSHRSDRSSAVRETLQPIAERFVIPRWMRERVRLILMAQRRLIDPERVAKTTLPRRDYYPDAADLYELGSLADDQDRESIQGWRLAIPCPSPPPPKPAKPKPRRRPHRPRYRRRR